MFKIKQTLVISCMYCALTFLSTLHAQEIQFQVNVDLNNIPFDSRIDIQNLKSDIINYLSTQKYADQDWEKPKVPVDIGITVTGKASNNTYSAILTVLSYTLLENGAKSVLMKSIEKNWSFEYAPGAALSFQNNRFNSLSSPIDYYMLTAMGLFLDTYGELEGTPFYEKAKLICRNGAAVNASGYTMTPDPSVPSKIGLVTELTDMVFDDFRKLIFSYHFDGLEALEKDKDSGKKVMANIITSMKTFKQKKVTMRSTLMDYFFNAKFMEIADIFKGYDDPELFTNLGILDPANNSIYQKAQDDR
ncbi:MAG: DUF4835 family protein [Bacteroidota bacterium]